MALATSPIALAVQAEKTSPVKLRNPPPWLHPRQLERTYAAILQDLVRQFARNVRETVISALPAIETEARLEQGREDSERTDAWFDRIAPLMDILRIGAQKRDTTVSATAVDIGQRTSDWNDKEWQKILRRTVGVGLITAEPGLRDQLRLFVQTNANLVTKMQSDAIEKIQGRIERGFATGARHTEIAKEIRADLETTESRARLIARDQVSKLNGQLTQMRQEEAGITKYIWRTAEDARVRASHAAMNGRLGRWDDATVYASEGDPNDFKARSGINAVELHPGQDFQCRCFAEPFIQELVETEEEAA
jgi:SPP1 gp7 family putative phage head morphogenesis protein